jgi:hypothetical protein
VAERQVLMTDLAKNWGRIEGLAPTVRSLEARAIAAETRPGEALKQRDAEPHPRKGVGATED